MRQRQAGAITEGSRANTVITLGLVVMALLLSLPPSTVYGQDEEERATVGEWVALALFSIVAAVLIVTYVVNMRRNTNRHTGLPTKVKRRRARGPLKGERWL
jgi:Ca2+/H+ antiporter